MLLKRVQLARNNPIGFDTIFSAWTRAARNLSLQRGSNSTGLRDMDRM
jgi:hypothetical protein